MEAGLQPTIVVLSPDPRLPPLLAGLPVRLVVNPQPEHGLSSSIRAGLAGLPQPVTAVVIAVADQPYLSAVQLEQLTDAYAEGQIVVSRYGDRTGTPLIYPRRLFPELEAVTGDTGGRVVADRHPEAVLEIEFEPRAGEDVDTRADWDRLRRRP